MLHPPPVRMNILQVKSKSELQIKQCKTSTAGFEPARAKPNRFQVCLLNHSDISTCCFANYFRLINKLKLSKYISTKRGRYTIQRMDENICQTCNVYTKPIYFVYWVLDKLPKPIIIDCQKSIGNNLQTYTRQGVRLQYTPSSPDRTYGITPGIYCCCCYCQFLIDCL